MGAAKEERRLVTDAAELRAGMRVEIDRCNFCQGVHRVMLLGLTTDYGGRTAHAIDPSAPCPQTGMTNLLVGPISVASRIVYRLEDGLEDPDTYTDELRSDEILAALRAEGRVSPKFLQRTR